MNPEPSTRLTIEASMMSLPSVCLACGQAREKIFQLGVENLERRRGHQVLGV